MRIFERDRVIALLDELLTACVEGQGRVVVIRGPTASGKTALLHAFAERAGRAGAKFVGATAARGESALPLGVIDQLLRDARMQGESATHTAQLLTEGVLAAPLPDSAADSSRTSVPDDSAAEVARHLSARVLPGLCQPLLELAVRGPVVIGVDDVQNADPASLHCLLYLARRLRSARILVVLTDRISPVRAHRLFHAELQGLAHYRGLDLHLLTRSGTTAMLAGQLGSRVAARLAVTCQVLTNGNPLLVQSLIEDYRSAGAASTAELIPGDAYGQAVVNCLFRCDADMRKVMRGLAALGEQVAPAVLGELVGLTADATAQVLSVLNGTGLLNAGWFPHYAARAAVVADLTSEERAAAARLLHNHGAPTLTVARHVLAAEGLDEPWTVPVLLGAAHQALAEDDVTLAVNCLQQAYKCAGDDRQRARIRSTLARAEWRINPSVAERHLPELTAAVRDGTLDGRAAAVPVSHLLWHGRVNEAHELLELLQRRQQESAGTDPNAWSHLDTIRWWMGYSYPHLFGRDQREEALRAMDARSTDWQPQLQAVAVLANAQTPDRVEDVLRSALLVLQGARVDDSTLPSIVAALTALIYSDQTRLAATWCDTVLAQVAGRRAPMWEASFTGLKSAIDLRLGNLAAAEKAAQSALSIVPAHCWGPAVAFVRASALAAQTARGRYDAAAATLALPIPEVAFQTPAGPHYLQARGRFHLANGRSEAALADFQTCGDLMMKCGHDQPSRVTWRTDAAEAYLGLGMDREARELVEEQRTALWPQQSRTWGLTLRVLASVSPLSQRPDLLNRAVRALQDCEDRYETAVAMADLSRAQRALGNASEARDLARRAHRLAVECGVESTTERFVFDAPEAGPVRPAPRTVPSGSPLIVLSEAELRVAELAAQGRTNRWIAAELFITVSTVEQHLTRVYRKLRVRRRADLPAELRDPAPPSAEEPDAP